MDEDIMNTHCCKGKDAPGGRRCRGTKWGREEEAGNMTTMDEDVSRCGRSQDARGPLWSLCESLPGVCRLAVSRFSASFLLADSLSEYFLWGLRFCTFVVVQCRCLVTVQVIK